MLRLQVNTSYFLLSPCLYCHDNFQCVYFFCQLFLHVHCSPMQSSLLKTVFWVHSVRRPRAKQWHGYWNKWLHSSFNTLFFHVVVVIFESCDMIHNVLRFMTIRKEPFTVYPYQSHQRFRLEYQMMLSALFSCVCISFVII